MKGYALVFSDRDEEDFRLVGKEEAGAPVGKEQITGIRVLAKVCQEQARPGAFRPRKEQPGAKTK